MILRNGKTYGVRTSDICHQITGGDPMQLMRTDSSILVEGKSQDSMNAQYHRTQAVHYYKKKMKQTTNT